jgi:hypothetical protein
MPQHYCWAYEQQQIWVTDSPLGSQIDLDFGLPNAANLDLNR